MAETRAPKSLSELEEQSLYENDFAEVPPPDIVAYNELRSCADLFRMHLQGILEVQPEFQRDVVWPGTAQTRFIDSLIKQLPIPSMCFAQDYKRQRWMVIDGLQRISTIVRFLKGDDWTLSRLEDIDSELAGKSAAAIKQPESPVHDFYTRVENLSIPITVLRCDFGKASHMEYLFTIFHRLNTGGMKLNNQEIRNCIYVGSFNRLLRKLDETPSWRRLNRMQPRKLYRLTKQELILRFLAFEEEFEKYNGHLAKFLNDYMHRHRDADSITLESKRRLFEDTVDCVWGRVFEGTPPNRLSITLLEGALVGVGRNIDFMVKQTPAVIQSLYATLVGHADYSEARLVEGLSKKARVIARLNAAVRIFSGQYDGGEVAHFEEPKES